MPYQIFNGSFKDFESVEGDLSFYKSELYLEKIEKNILNDISSDQLIYEYIFTPYVLGLLSYFDKDRKFKILDYGGGIGRSYVNLNKSLIDDRNLEYFIYDSKENCSLGKKHLSNKKNLFFFSDLNRLNFDYDLLHFGSVIQYIEDLRSELHSLFEVNKKKQPKHILISDAFVGVNESFITQADYYGYKHPFKFRSWEDLIGDLELFNYKIKAKVPHVPQINNHFEFYDMSNLPKGYRIKNTWHILLEAY